MNTRDQILGTVLERTDSKGPVIFGERPYKRYISIWGIYVVVCYGICTAKPFFISQWYSLEHRAFYIAVECFRCLGTFSGHCKRIQVLWHSEDMG